MNKFVNFLFITLAVVTLSLFWSTSASAAETYEYWFDFVSTDGNTYHASFSSAYEFVAYYDSIDTYNGIVYTKYGGGFIDPNFVQQTSNWKNITVRYNEHPFSSSIVCSDIREVLTGHSWQGAVSISTNIPIFDSLESARTYANSGDDSGQINKDLSNVTHLFSNDLIDTNIPNVELSNLSHNGFKIVNYSEEYCVDLYVESFFNGVTIDKIAGSYVCVTDYDWIYAKHIYNFADGYGKQNLTYDGMDMRSVYSVYNQENLIEDFRNWSVAYPNLWDLPDYSWTKAGASNTNYTMKYILDEDETEATHEKQLMNAELGQTVYYVRFYKVVDNEKIGGYWTKWTFRDGVAIGSDIITAGQVNVDSNGDIYITDEVDGWQNKDTGEVDFTVDIMDYTDFSESGSFTWFFDVLEDTYDGLSGFPKLVSKVFGFLPSSIVVLLGLIIGVCVVLRILGR